MEQKRTKRRVLGDSKASMPFAKVAAINGEGEIKMKEER